MMSRLWQFLLSVLVAAGIAAAPVLYLTTLGTNSGCLYNPVRPQSSHRLLQKHQQASFAGKTRMALASSIRLSSASVWESKSRATRRIAAPASRP